MVLPALSLLGPLLAILSSAPASASPVVDPVVDPAVARLRLAALAGASATLVEQDGCQGEACQAWDQRAQTGIEAQLALLPGLGLAVGLGRERMRVDEADFDARGLALAGSLRLALPLGGPWYAHGQGRIESSRPSNEGPDGQRAQSLEGSLTLGMAVGGLDGGFVGHLGAQARPLRRLQVEPLGASALRLDLDPARPVGLVGGFSFLSEPMGGAWTGAPRLAAHVEATLIHASGVNAGLGLAW